MQESPAPEGGGALDEWRRHWRIGLVALVGSGLSYSIWINLSSLFVQPMQDAFGWTRGQIGLAQNATLISAMLAPLMGRLVDRFGVRQVLLIGVTLTALMFIALSQVSSSLLHFYLLYAGLAVAGLTTSGISYSRLVCGTFIRSRGLALAIARAGLAIASAVMPLVMFQAMGLWGWRAGIASMGVAMLLLVLPLVWLWVPASSAQQHAAHDASKAPLRRDWHMLASRKVWTLCLAAAFAYVPLVSTFSQLQPMLVGMGLPAAQAAGLLGLIGISAIFGAAITGVLIDRVWAPWVALAFTLLPCMGFALLQGMEVPSPFLAGLSIMLLGIGYGAEADLLAYMAARYFGLVHYGAIYGLAILCISVGTSIGVSGIGLAHDHFHNYQFALWVAAGLSAVSGLLYLSLGRYPHGQE